MSVGSSCCSATANGTRRPPNLAGAGCCPECIIVMAYRREPDIGTTGGNLAWDAYPRTARRVTRRPAAREQLCRTPPARLHCPPAHRGADDAACLQGRRSRPDRSRSGWFDHQQTYSPVCDVEGFRQGPHAPQTKGPSVPRMSMAVVGARVALAMRRIFA